MATVPHLQEIIHQIMILEFFTQDKINEFWEMVKNARTLSKSDFKKEMTKFNEKWQQEKKREAGRQEHQTG